jgi:glyoxylase-like metal-dependent hydrolase (beta-lactamase superfamily II)
MLVPASGLSWIDLKFRGSPHVVGTAVIVSEGSIALVDPGPTSCLETLELGLNALGLRCSDVTHLLLTHVHLDHAGATGTLARRHPHLKVFVHERGAPHLIDPAKLLRSATRLYGDHMEVLWGEIAPVPASNVFTLAGDGERVEAGGRVFEVAYTPGHASHHISFFDRASGVAFVGDAAGIRIEGSYVRPPTPPPDIDVELWTRTVERINAWSPETMFLTHSGNVRNHLQSFLDNLEAAADWVRCSLGEPGTDEERARRYAEYLRGELEKHLTSEQIRPHHVGAAFEVSWHGLARYWRRRGLA